MAARLEFEATGMPWRRFQPWLDERWDPGDHMALVGPTKAGKSTLAAQILPLRRYVLALDPKGGDSTVGKLLHHGFVRVESWPPPRKVYKAIEEGRPARLVVGPVVRTRADLPKLRGVIADALDDAFERGGWTVYIDELQVASDRRLMNLSGPIERLLIAARDKGVSVVSSFQAPRWVPRAATDQAWWLITYPTRDTDVQNRLAEMAGRPKAEIRGAMAGLENHCVLVFDRDARAPVVVTRAPAL